MRGIGSVRIMGLVLAFLSSKTCGSPVVATKCDSQADRGFLAHRSISKVRI